MPKPQRPKREREFGVPFPGDILDDARWTQTALKKFPPEHLDWEILFGRSAPVVIDLGCGNGRYLIGSALWREGMNHLGVDILPLVIRYATRRANQRGLNNIRFGVSGGRELLEQHVAPSSVREIHCYHPQPYYQPEEISKRLITPGFLILVCRALEQGGEFYLQTDHPAYWNYIQKLVPLFFDFEERPQTWPDAPKGRTRREIIALRSGLSVFRGVGKPRVDLDLEAATRTAEHLPLPTFNADRSLYDLDRLERSE